MNGVELERESKIQLTEKVIPDITTAEMRFFFPFRSFFFPIRCPRVGDAEADAPVRKSPADNEELTLIQMRSSSTAFARQKKAARRVTKIVSFASHRKRLLIRPHRYRKVASKSKKSTFSFFTDSHIIIRKRERTYVIAGSTIRDNIMLMTLADGKGVLKEKKSDETQQHYKHFGDIACCYVKQILLVFKCFYAR